MSDLLASVMGMLGDQGTEQIAQKLGTSPAQAKGAIAAALPLILGGLSRNASSEQGADSLRRAIEKDNHGSDLGGLVGQILGGNGQGMGDAILGHVFGNRRPRADQGLSKVTGLDAGSASQLLAMLAPLVMGALGNKAREGGLDSGGLGSLLGQEQRKAQQQGGAADGLLGAVLDRDGDGDVDFQDLMKVGGGMLGNLFGK
jgi:hypothetical protein